ncbi:MAG: UMP kinase, partial [Methanosarcinales archaeon]|nr:UMP kinase [Methanosarcinales archaeon]
MKIVISIGGSVLVSNLEPARIKQYADAIRKIAMDNELFVVTGGGVAARDYIKTARALGANEMLCDLLGIDVTRINATLLIAALGEDAYPQVPKTYEEAQRAFELGKIVVMGGVVPGQTTDAVSVMLAELLGAELVINATSVDGVYTADPKSDPDAKKFDTMTPAQLVDIVIRTEMKAGSNSPIDPLAAKIIERCNMPMIVVDGR